MEIKSFTHSDIINLCLYAGLVIILIAYSLYAKRRKHHFHIPVALFIIYFILVDLIIVVSKFDLEPALIVLKLLSTIFLTFSIIRFFAFIFIDYSFREKNIPAITRDIILAVLYVISVLVILRYQANVNLASLITTSAVVTAVIGFALQDTLSNLFSGIVLQMEKPYHIHDWICVENYSGKVVGMSWKSTKIYTREKELISIPNNIIAKSHILNYSKPDPNHIAILEIGISYDDAPNIVREAMLTTVGEHPKVNNYPPPEVRVLNFNDFTIDYQIRFSISDFENEERIKSHIMNQLWYRFKRRGIKIPFPIRTVHNVQAMPEKEEMEKNKASRRAIIHLQMVDIFSPISEEYLNSIAAKVRFENYSQYETIIREGSSGDSMFVVVSGLCEVLKKDDTGKDILIAELGENNFFGEMTLLTGEPRSATVKAKEDVVCIRIGKKDLESIMKEHSTIADAMSEILAKRKDDLDAKKNDRNKKMSSAKKEASNILLKIKAFFKI